MHISLLFVLSIRSAPFAVVASQYPEDTKGLSFASQSDRFISSYNEIVFLLRSHLSCVFKCIIILSYPKGLRRRCMKIIENSDGTHGRPGFIGMSGGHGGSGDKIWYQCPLMTHH